MARPHLLLTVTVAGTVYRIADDDLDVTYSHAGLVYSYAAGLSSATVSSTLAFLSASASYASTPIECLFPVGVAKMAAQGIDIARADVELSLWLDGDDYTARTVLASGQVSDPTYGSETEPVAFSIERIARTSTTTVPSITERVDGTTHPSTITVISTADLGLSYPIVFGQPYALADDGSAVPGSQGVWSSYDTLTAGVDAELIIAGHALNQTFVYVQSDDVTVRLVPVWTRLDALGQRISFISSWTNYPTNTTYTATVIDGYTCYGLKYSASGASEFSPVSDSIPVFIWWYSPKAGDTGGLSPYAPDVIAYMLDRAGLPRVSGFTDPAIKAFRLDCVIDSPAKPEEWLQANVYPLLPVSIVDGPTGMEAIVWRYDATRQDATARIDVDNDGGIARSGVVRTDSGDIANRITLKYAYDVQAGRHTRTRTRGDTANPDAYCTASQARYGIIERTVETAIVYSDATADLILAWIVRAYSSPRRRVSYMIPTTYTLTRGQVVLLTDTELHLDVVCLVADVQVDGTGVNGVEFLIIADSLRDQYEAS